MKPHRILAAALLGVAMLTASTADACTNFLFTKGATTDGSTMITYAADSHTLYGELYYRRAADYAAGATFMLVDWDSGTPLFEIPQVSHTYSVVGNMNEHQLAIGETTYGGRSECHKGKVKGIDYGSLIYVTLQRAKNAREAIATMAKLVADYGYSSSGESFSIADPNEAWIMDMIGKGPGRKGAVWVAVRIPDDCISGHANQSRIRQFPLKDKANCLYSKDVISFAREKGYFNGKDEDFSFSEAYAPTDFGAQRFCEARVWSFFNRWAADDMQPYLSYAMGETTDNPMPLYVRPKSPLDVQDVKDMMRDHYEGTPMDITSDLGAGAWQMPYRPTPLRFEVDGQAYFNERPISTQQSANVYVSQMRSWLPNHIGGIVWFANDDANMAPFTPVYCCVESVPECYDPREGDCFH